MKTFAPDKVLNHKTNELSDTDMVLSEYFIAGIVPLNDGALYNKGYRTSIITQAQSMYVTKKSVREVRGELA